METKNHLGLDKFQLTIIKSNYNSMKPSINKRAKILKKIEDTTKKYEEKLEAAISSLRNEVAAYDEQITMLDQFTKDTTLKTCGITLTTEQVMEFCNNPEKFEEYKNSIGLGNSLFNQNEQNIPQETVELEK